MSDSAFEREQRPENLSLLYVEEAVRNLAHSRTPRVSLDTLDEEGNATFKPLSKEDAEAELFRMTEENAEQRKGERIWSVWPPAPLEDTMLDYGMASEFAHARIEARELRTKIVLRSQSVSDNSAFVDTDSPETATSGVEVGAVNASTEVEQDHHQVASNTTTLFVVADDVQQIMSHKSISSRIHTEVDVAERLSTFSLQNQKYRIWQSVTPRLVCCWPLEQAVWNSVRGHGHPQAVQVLLDHGADIFVHSEMSGTLLNLVLETHWHDVRRANGQRGAACVVEGTPAGRGASSSSSEVVVLGSKGQSESFGEQAGKELLRALLRHLQTRVYPNDPVAYAECPLLTGFSTRVQHGQAAADASINQKELLFFSPVETAVRLIDNFQQTSAKEALRIMVEEFHVPIAPEKLKPRVLELLQIEA
ncbi:unnamed protein product [Amoebophrya sp. A25]|nr:unnamed protein product [Amoebophrya sp. A25]|eukprot:GSA25T00025693001.1